MTPSDEPPSLPVPDLNNGSPCTSFPQDGSAFEYLMDNYSNKISVNKTYIYHISKDSLSSYGSLVDRGANGAIAGVDVHVLGRTGLHVSETGIVDQ